jgi:hypothetical protein
MEGFIACPLSSTYRFSRTAVRLRVAGLLSRKRILAWADSAVWDLRVRSPRTRTSGSRSATVSQLIWGHSSWVSEKAFRAPTARVMAPGAPQQPAR